MLSWIDFVTMETGYNNYDLLLEEISEEELEQLQEDYDDYVMEYVEGEGYYD